MQRKLITILKSFKKKIYICLSDQFVFVQEENTYMICMKANRFLLLG